MICFCYFCFCHLGMAHNDPFFCANWAPEKQFLRSIFKRFYQLFFRTTGLQHKLLILIESPGIFHWKSEKKVKWVWSLGRNLGEIRSNVHSVHWDINPPQKHPSSFLPSPSLNLQTVQVPPF